MEPHGYEPRERGSFSSDFLESYFTGMIIETNLELIEDAFAAKDIKSDSKAFRKSNRRDNLKFTNTKCEILDVGRNVTTVADYNHLEPTITDIDSHPFCCLNVKDAKDGSGVNINPDLLVKDGEGNDWYQVTLMGGIRKFYKDMPYLLHEGR